MNVITMKRATLRLAVLAVAGGGLLALGQDAGAAPRCAAPAKNRLAPYLLSPCDGATVKSHSAITFTVFDRDPAARRYAPYLSVSTTRKVVDGRLEPTTNGEGIFHQLAPDTGRAHTWTYTAAAQPYSSWWDNTPGTYYVQVEQIDYRPSNGTYSSPITSVRVR
jgi:hypothetical protein